MLLSSHNSVVNIKKGRFLKHTYLSSLSFILSKFEAIRLHIHGFVLYLKVKIMSAKRHNSWFLSVYDSVVNFTKGRWLKCLFLTLLCFILSNAGAFRLQIHGRRVSLNIKIFLHKSVKLLYFNTHLHCK